MFLYVFIIILNSGCWNSSQSYPALPSTIYPSGICGPKNRYARASPPLWDPAEDCFQPRTASWVAVTFKLWIIPYDTCDNVAGYNQQEFEISNVAGSSTRIAQQNSTLFCAQAPVHFFLAFKNLSNLIPFRRNIIFGVHRACLAHISSLSNAQQGHCCWEVFTWLASCFKTVIA